MLSADSKPQKAQKMTSIELSVNDPTSPEEVQVDQKRDPPVSKFKTDVKEYKESTHYTYDHSSTTQGTSNAKT